MAKLSVLQAAREGWAPRQTLYRKIKAGRLSAETDTDGRTVIDTAELARVFGAPVPSGTGTETHERGKMGAADNAVVQVELARLRADLEFERQRGERLMGLLEAAQRQLTDQRPRWSWWSRLFRMER